MRLQKKVAIVTGGSRGIGRAISLGLARQGAKVIVSFRKDEKSADDTVALIRQENGEAIAVRADVAGKKDINHLVKKAVEEYGKIDILINNAGVCPFVDVFKVTEEIWDWTHAVNVRGPFFLTQAVARVMVNKNIKGKIVNITSISGQKATNPLQVLYCTSKGAANMLTKVMALALARHKINVNAILPGTIETDINRDVLKDRSVRQGIIENTPLKCLGVPEDIVGAVIYLSSDEANWVTGALLPIDGGFIA